MKGALELIGWVFEDDVDFFVILYSDHMRLKRMSVIFRERVKDSLFVLPTVCPTCCWYVLEQTLPAAPTGVIPMGWCRLTAPTESSATATSAPRRSAAVSGVGDA